MWAPFVMSGCLYLSKGIGFGSKSHSIRFTQVREMTKLIWSCQMHMWWTCLLLYCSYLLSNNLKDLSLRPWPSRIWCSWMVWPKFFGRISFSFVSFFQFSVFGPDFCLGTCSLMGLNIFSFLWIITPSEMVGVRSSFCWYGCKLLLCRVVITSLDIWVLLTPLGI